MVSTFLALAAIVPAIAAHGHIDAVFTSDGTKYPLTGPDWVYNDKPSPSWRAGNQDNGFVASTSDVLSSGQVACHKDKIGGSGPALPAKGDPIPVQAGQSLGIHWASWTNHQGPTMDYLAKCPGACADLTDATALEWFKIREVGWEPDGPDMTTDQKWESVPLGKYFMTQNVTIPINLLAGEYVHRHEIIALHSAAQSGSAQLYPMCFNIVVSGGGSDLPQGVVASQLYNQEDPGIHVNVWYPTPTDYKIPGPPIPAVFANANAVSASRNNAVSANPNNAVSANTNSAVSKKKEKTVSKNWVA